MKKIILKSTKNFRDLGNVRGENGKIISTGFFIRGRSLYKVCDKDLKTLTRETGIKTIIDLRTHKEVQEKPNPVIEGVKYLHMPVFNEAKAGISHEKKSESYYSLKRMGEIADVYRSLVQDDTIPKITEILKTILTLEETQYPVLFHCTAGKDRTGIIAALIYKFLGASDDAIYGDYLQTNKESGLKPAILPPLIAMFLMSPKLARRAKRYFVARKEYLNGFFDELEKKYGSLENYFKVELKFTPEESEQIKAKFLNNFPN